VEGDRKRRAALANFPLLSKRCFYGDPGTWLAFIYDKQINNPDWDQKSQGKGGGKRGLNRRCQEVQGTVKRRREKSSEKSKPIARWGHKADGSLQRDGRAAGEKKEQKKRRRTN